MNFENETLETKSPASPGAVLTIVLLSYLIIVLDISIVITGLPEIRQTLVFTHIETYWKPQHVNQTMGNLTQFFG